MFKKFIFTTLSAFFMVVGLAFVSTAIANADTPTTTPVTADQLDITTSYNQRILKKMRCNARAGKVESPAPPRDPFSKCKGKIKVKFHVALKTQECPPRWVGGSAAMSVDVTQKVKVKALSKSIANGRVRTWAATRQKVKDAFSGWVTTSCARIPDVPVTPPPPPSYDKPDVNVTPVACVEPGQSRDVTVTVGNPNPISDTARLTYRGEMYEQAIAANSSATFTFPNQGAGSYSGMALLVNAGKSASFTVTVEECDAPPPPPVDNPPVVNIYGAPAHLYTGGTAQLWIEASDADDDALQVSVKAAGQGSTCEQGVTNCVTGLIPVDVRWDGTSCPSGVKCYRATAWAGSTPGTFTAVATVTANGKTVSNDVSFPVVADEF